MWFCKLCAAPRIPQLNEVLWKKGKASETVDDDLHEKFEPHMQSLQTTVRPLYQKIILLTVPAKHSAIEANLSLPYGTLTTAHLKMNVRHRSDDVLEASFIRLKACIDLQISKQARDPSTHRDMYNYAPP